MGIEFPLYAKAMSHMPFASATEVSRAVLRARLYVEESIVRYWKQLRTNLENENPTLLTKESGSVDEGSITQVQLDREMFAGTDTTAVAGTDAMWLLCIIT